MLKRFVFICVVQIFFCLNVFAQIFDIKSMNQILPYVVPDSLIVFDLDDTVVTTGLTGTEPTEPDLPNLISNLQISGNYVMALTARAPEIGPLTRTQLESIGVNFDLSPPYPSSFVLDPYVWAYYTQGIAYVGSFANKGTELVDFLNTTQIAPSQIIFVDNTPKNVQNVENSLSMLPIEHFSFHYEHSGP